MGLDMYLEGHKFFWGNYEQPEKNLIEDGFPLKGKELELGYWRKHQNLHDYIVQTFADGWRYQCHMCQKIELDADDVDTIIAAIQGLHDSHGAAEEIEKDIQIFKRAKAWLAERQKGVSKSIIYRASW